MLRSQMITDSNYRPCMQCATQENPKTVMPGSGYGVEVRKRGTNELVGYLHANCKAAWIAEHGEKNYSFRPF
jgi:hypothetical protein